MTMTDEHGGARPGGPDWRHDPRDTAAVRSRRARHAHWTRWAAAVVAVLLVAGGTVFVGFVTGRISLPVLGTLTPRPASVATFKVGSTTFLMQQQTSGSIRISEALDGSGDRTSFVADLAQPAPDAISATSDPTHTTYFVVLPPGAHDVKGQPKDSTALVSDVISPVPSLRSGPARVGLISTVHTSPHPSGALAVPGLASVRWVDADGKVHTSALPG